MGKKIVKKLKKQKDVYTPAWESKGSRERVGGRLIHNREVVTARKKKKEE